MWPTAGLVVALSCGASRQQPDSSSGSATTVVLLPARQAGTTSDWFFAPTYCIGHIDLNEGTRKLLSSLMAAQGACPSRLPTWCVNMTTCPVTVAAHMQCMPRCENHPGTSDGPRFVPRPSPTVYAVCSCVLFACSWQVTGSCSPGKCVCVCV